MKATTLALFAILAAGIAAAPVIGAPKPSAVPFAWQLQIRIEGVPRPIRVKVPGKAGEETFWFLRYTVINRTGKDQIFVPDFTLYTDTGKMYRAGKGVPSAVFEKIKGVYDDPLLTDMVGMTGTLLQGEDNAREGVAIWKNIDPNAGAFSIFIGGLSGETVEVPLPAPIDVTVTDPKTGEKKTVKKTKVVLSKTLELNYSLPGNENARFTEPPKLLEETWVMR